MSVVKLVRVVPEFDKADRLRKSLQHAGVGVQEMASYLDVSRGSISNWISGRVVPSKQTMRLWAIRCGVPLAWLETGQAPALPPGPDGCAARDSNPEPASNVYRLVRAGLAVAA